MSMSQRHSDSGRPFTGHPVNRCPGSGSRERDPHRLPRRWADLARLLWVHRVWAAAAALLWLLLRSGTKPSRVVYPCQQAALANLSLVLAPPLAGALFRLGRGPRTRKTATRLGVTALAAASAVLLGLAVSMPGSPGAGDTMRAPLLPDPDYTADIYVVQNAQGPSGDHHLGVDALIACLAADSLKFYRSTRSGQEFGPDGIVGPHDVVLIKINSQWEQRGGTNTDVLRGLVERILEHPDGFSGEIVVVENTQTMGRLDWAQANAEDHGQSAQDVVNYFAGLGRPVSAYLWDNIRTTSVSEYSAGDMRDGYVVGPQIPDTQIRVSYPKFLTAGGHRVSLKYGIWDGASGSYSDSSFCFLNVPILKCHGAVYGVTATLKHHVGTMTTALLTNTHNAVRFGGLGSFLSEVRMPDLNVLDCIYILAIPSGGPWCTYEQATRVNQLVAGRDPVAIDIWATKNILVPTIIANGYTSYPMQDPDNPSSIFRTYLDRTTNVLLAAGIEVTSDLAHISAHECDGSHIASVPAGAAPPGGASCYPNPARGTSTIRFDLPASGTVTLDIYDAQGLAIRTIREGKAASTACEIVWDGKDNDGRAVPSGTYLYRVTATGLTTTGKIMLAR